MQVSNVSKQKALVLLGELRDLPKRPQKKRKRADPTVQFYSDEDSDGPEHTRKSSKIGGVKKGGPN